jgi:2-hydroxyglutarate dehydrogenase
LLEKEAKPGTGTSSRNSQVIHAGIYYPSSSLKMKLCLSGRQQLYDMCRTFGIDHQQCGKWIIGQTEKDAEYLEMLKRKGEANGVPLRFLSKQEMAQEPRVKAEYALESPLTGIINVHQYIDCLEVF